MQKKVEDKGMRVLCEVMFLTFTVCWIHFFQRDLICAAYKSTFPGTDSLFTAIPHLRLILSVALIAIVLCICALGRLILRFRGGLYGCNYLPAAVYVGAITGFDGHDLFGQTTIEWFTATAFFVVLLIVCKIVASVPKSSYNTNQRAVAGNLLIMSLLFILIGILGNTDENLHRKLYMERLYSEEYYSELLEVGRHEEESNPSIDLLRAKSMLNLPATPAGSEIGEMLFRYNISDPNTLADSLDNMTYTQAFLSSCLLKGDIASFRDSIHLEDYKQLPTYYMQALILADDSLASVRFPNQFNQETERYNAFLNELDSVSSEPIQIQANTTFIAFHESYYWFYTFRK